MNICSFSMYKRHAWSPAGRQTSYQTVSSTVSQRSWLFCLSCWANSEYLCMKNNSQSVVSVAASAFIYIYSYSGIIIIIAHPLGVWPRRGRSHSPQIARFIQNLTKSTLWSRGDIYVYIYVVLECLWCLVVSGRIWLFCGCLRFKRIGFHHKCYVEKSRNPSFWNKNANITLNKIFVDIFVHLCIWYATGMEIQLDVQLECVSIEIDRSRLTRIERHMYAHASTHFNIIWLSRVWVRRKN